MSWRQDGEVLNRGQQLLSRLNTTARNSCARKTKRKEIERETEKRKSDERKSVSVLRNGNGLETARGIVERHVIRGETLTG
jgi:hypothetical protein